METLWLVVVAVTMVAYPIFLVRSALRGRRWAMDTLEAMRYLEGHLTATTWRPPGDQEERPSREAQESARSLHPPSVVRFPPSPSGASPEADGREAKRERRL